MLTDRQFTEVTDIKDCKAILKHEDSRVLNMSEVIDGVAKITGRDYSALYHFACESPFNLNGEKHRQVKRMLASYFSAKRLKLWQPSFEGIIRSVVSESLTKDSIDLIDDWVEPITALCSYHSMGLDKSIDEPAKKNIESLLLLTSFQRPMKLKDLALFNESAKDIASLIIEHRLQAPGDDLNNDLYGYLESNFTLTRDEICGFMTILLGAGTSTKHTLTNLVVELLSIAPRERRLIFDEMDAHEFVERGLFSGGAVNYIYRTLDDKNIQCLNIAAANDGAKRCPFSSKSDKDAPTNEKHIAFGFGAHKCIGEALSKNIMATAIDIIVKQCPNAIITSGLAPRVHTHSQQPKITVDV